MLCHNKNDDQYGALFHATTFSVFMKIFELEY